MEEAIRGGTSGVRMSLRAMSEEEGTEGCYIDTVWDGRVTSCNGDFWRTMARRPGTGRH